MGDHKLQEWFLNTCLDKVISSNSFLLLELSLCGLAMVCSILFKLFQFVHMLWIKINSEKIRSMFFSRKACDLSLLMKGSIWRLLHISVYFVSFNVTLNFMLDCYAVLPLDLKNSLHFLFFKHKCYWLLTVLWRGLLHVGQTFQACILFISCVLKWPHNWEAYAFIWSEAPFFQHPQSLPALLAEQQKEIQLLFPTNW